MGAGENGAVGAPANRAGNAYQASKSADSSAHAKFANALNQEHGNSQVHGGGTRTPTVAPGKGSSPSVTDAKTADARARDPILGQDATGLKPGETISAKLTTKQDITNPQAEMTFDLSKQITKDQAAAILFQRGKVPDGATLTQGKGNQWTVQYRNNIHAKQDVVTHMNSHTESVSTRSKLPGEMFYPEPDVTFSWVGGAKAFSTTKIEPPRRDLKNDMGFVISKRYALDEGQSPHMNLRRMVQPGPGYEVVFDKPKTADQVKDTFFEKGVRDDQVRVIPVGKEPTATWQVQMLDGMAELKLPAARALQDSTVYAKEAIAPGLPDGVKAHIQNQTVPADAKRFAPDVYVWEQEGHIVRVETNGKKGDAGYYKYEETKLHPTDQQGNDTMRWLMLEQGLPVRKAWQEYIKHWDQIHTGMLGAVGGAGRFTPRYMGGGGGPRSAWQEPIASRSRGNSGPGAGNPGSGGPAATKSQKLLPPGVTYTDAGGTGPHPYGGIAIKPSGDVHVTTGTRPGGRPAHIDLMNRQFGPLQTGDRRFGIEGGAGSALVTKTSGATGFPTQKDLPSIQRALSEAGRLEGAIVHVVEGKAQMSFQWTGEGWKRMNYNP
jgi:hypothetical protein